MSRRTRACRWVLVVFGVLALADGLLLTFWLGETLEWLGWTWYDPSGGKILAAALLALGIGALAGAVDPYRNRVVVWMLLVFTLSGAVLMLYRVLAEPELTPDFARVLAAVLAVFFVALCVWYPRRDD